MTDPGTQPRLSRLNNNFKIAIAENRENLPKQTSSINVRSASKASNYSFDASPTSNLNLGYDGDDSSSAWSRNPSVSIDDSSGGFGRYRDWSADPAYEQRGRGYSLASMATSEASFIMQNFGSSRGRELGLASDSLMSGILDDPINDNSDPAHVRFDTHRHGDENIGSPYPMGNQFMQQFPTQDSNEFRNRDGDRKFWNALQHRLKSINEQALNLMTLQTDIEMVQEGVDVDMDNRFAAFANILRKRMSSRPYDDSQTITQQVMNLDLPNELLFVFEVLDKEPSTLSKLELNKARRIAYEHAAKYHTKTTEHQVQRLILEEMTKLSREIEFELRDFEAAASVFISRVLNDLEQTDNSKSEQLKHAAELNHYRRETVLLRDQISSLEDRVDLNTSLESAKSDAAPKFVPLLNEHMNSGLSKKLSSPPTEDEADQIEKLKQQMQEQAQSDIMVLEAKISKLDHQAKKEHDEAQILKAKLRRQEHACADLTRAIEEQNLNLEEYKMREIHFGQKLQEKNNQLEIMQAQFARLEEEVAKHSLPKEVTQIISLQSEMNMMLPQVSVSASKSPRGAIGSIIPNSSEMFSEVALNETDVAYFGPNILGETRSLSIDSRGMSVGSPDPPSPTTQVMKQENPFKPPAAAQTQDSDVLPTVVVLSQSPQGMVNLPATGSRLHVESPLHVETNSLCPDSVESSISNKNMILTDTMGLGEENQPSLSALSELIDDTDHSIETDDMGKQVMAMMAAENGARGLEENGGGEKPILHHVMMDELSTQAIWNAGGGTERSRVDMADMGTEYFNERTLAHKSNSIRVQSKREEKEGVQSSKSNIVSAAESTNSERENIILRKKVIELDTKLRETEGFLKFSYVTVRKLEAAIEAEKHRQSNVPPPVDNGWKKEKKDFLNVISRLESESDQLKYQLDKTRKQYKKLLKSRPSARGRIEVSPNFYHNSLNTVHSRRSVMKFFSNYSKERRWLHRVDELEEESDVILYRLEFETQEIWCRFSLLYPLIILLGTVCGIEKRSISYVTLLASSVASKKIAMAKLVGELKGMCTQRQSDKLYLYIFSFFKSLFFFHDSLADFIGSRNALLLEYLDGPDVDLASTAGSVRVHVE